MKGIYHGYTAGKAHAAAEQPANTKDGPTEWFNATNNENQAQVETQMPPQEKHSRVRETGKKCNNADSGTILRERPASLQRVVS
jgi:hypothetical protein